MRSPSERDPPPPLVSTAGALTSSIKRAMVTVAFTKRPTAGLKEERDDETV